MTVFHDMSEIMGQPDAAMRAYAQVENVVPITSEMTKEDKGCD